MDHRFITTAFDLPGYQITGTLGLVRGIVVRSRSVVGQFGAQLQTIFGGNITIYTDLCERARMDAYNQMAEHAAALGANGIIGVRYDATEMMPGITEVLCYGTAVLVQSACMPNRSISPRTFCLLKSGAMLTQSMPSAVMSMIRSTWLRG